eukprot:764996-Hanusia_phi.AAC.2
MTPQRISSAPSVLRQNKQSVRFDPHVQNLNLRIDKDMKEDIDSSFLTRERRRIFSPKWIQRQKQHEGIREDLCYIKVCNLLISMPFRSLPSSRPPQSDEHVCFDTWLAPKQWYVYHDGGHQEWLRVQGIGAYTFQWIAEATQRNIEYYEERMKKFKEGKQPKYF